MDQLSPAEFDRSWGKTYSSVFSGRHVVDGAFVNRRWKTILLPHTLGYFEESTHQSLAAAAAAVGDTVYVVTQIEGEPHTENAIVGWGEAELARLRCETQFLLDLDCAVFGRSAAWGLLCLQSLDGVSYLGGSPRFMEVFEANAGSERVLRERFASFAATDWDIPRNTKLAMLAAVGW